MVQACQLETALGGDGFDAVDTDGSPAERRADLVTDP